MASFYRDAVQEEFSALLHPAFDSMKITMAVSRALKRVYKYLTPILYQVPSSRVISRHHLTCARVHDRNRFQLQIPVLIPGFCTVRIYRLAWGLYESLDSKHIPPALIFNVIEKFSVQFFVEKLENIMAVSEAKRLFVLFSLLSCIFNLPSLVMLSYNRIENAIRLSESTSFFCQISLLFPVGICLTWRSSLPHICPRLVVNSPQSIAIHDCRLNNFLSDK